MIAPSFIRSYYPRAGSVNAPPKAFALVVLVRAKLNNSSFHKNSYEHLARMGKLVQSTRLPTSFLEGGQIAW